MHILSYQVAEYNQHNLERSESKTWTKHLGRLCHKPSSF